MNILLSKKYSPKTSGDIPQQAAVKQLKDFIITHKQQKKKAALIYGPSGTCKSCSVYALADELNLEIIEINASDFRNSDEIQSKIGQALKQQSLFSQGKVILVDEVDGIAGNEDRGGVPTLASLIADAKFPVVMTANDPWDSKFSPLRSKSMLIEFPALDTNTVFSILRKICDIEQIICEDSNLKTLARRSGGDLRGAINDLQVLSTCKKITAENMSQDLSRNKIDTMMNALMKIFKSTDVNVAVSALDSVEEELEQTMLWLQENLPKEYTNPQDLALAYDSLSRADVFMGRIRKRQHWRFLSYANTMMTAGVTSAKKEKSKSFVKYAPTMRLLKIWQTNRKYAPRNSIVEKLAQATHSSKAKTLQSTLPFLKHAYHSNKTFAQDFISALKLEEEEIAWLDA